MLCHLANFIYAFLSFFFVLIHFVCLLFVFEAGTLTKFAVNRLTEKKKNDLCKKTKLKKEKNGRKIERVHVGRL